MAGQLTLDPRTFVVLEADREMSKFLGVPREKIVGRTFWAWVSEPNSRDLGNALTVSLRNGQPRQFKVLLKIEGGHPLPFDLTAQPFPRDLDRPVLKLTLQPLNENAVAQVLRLRSSRKA